MKKILKTLKGLALSKRYRIIFASVFTVAFVIMIPVYAWFANQKKAAEMFKVGYPNVLYINAAHREDQINMALDGINVNEYLYDTDGNPQEDNEGNPIKITEERYVFSVSGSNTTQFILQMAHTNNNLFTYKIYAATEQTTKPSSGTYVEYKATNEHTENKMIFTGDTVSDGDMLLTEPHHSYVFNRTRDFGCLFENL